LQLKVEDISISRQQLKWGIPLPFDTEQTTYVWVDALINYLSGIDYFKIKEDLSAEFPTADFWPCDLHIIGKDILWFHSVIWPAMLLSINLQLPKKILAHGFFTIEGKKMSKTLGNVIRPKDLVDIFGIDATRALVLSMFPIDTDGNFSIAELKTKYNINLADNFGNLVNRAFGMLLKYCKDKFQIRNISNNVKHQVIDCVRNYRLCFDKLEVHKVVDIPLELSSFANKYIHEKTPWNLAKENKVQDLQQIISDLLYCIKTISLLLYPVMPDKMGKLFQHFGPVEDIQEDFIKLIQNNIIYIKHIDLHSPEILFKKIK
ncbi:MAG: methionine--tRNA ligase, partial [Endomicrobia bacterium]|nr:methionine--tRNA ligase [Endomicrobiia bacterium]